MKIVLCVLLVVHVAMGAESSTQPTTLPVFDKLWDYSKPAETEKKFREVLAATEKSADISYRAELLTQIARTQGLQGKFVEAHATLDSVEKMLTDEMKLPRVRYLLERGRVFRSSDRPAESLPLFHQAADLSGEIEQWRYHIDAVHMIALAAAEPAEKVKWNLRGIHLVETHPAERGWLHALYNNLGETYLQMEKYEDALATFQKLVELDQKSPQMYPQLDVARCLNLLKRYDDALKELEGIGDKGKDDGYFQEQMGEALAGLGRRDEARTFSAKGYELLKNAEWIKSDSKRLARLKQMAEK